MVAVAGWLVFGLGSILVPLARHLDICPGNCLGTLVLVAGVLVIGWWSYRHVQWHLLKF